MTLDVLVLQKLARWRPDSTQQVLDVPDPASGWTVTLVADLVDAVGARLSEVRLTRLSPLADARPLKERAETLAARVRGLMEPLALIEADADHGMAQLRSQTPWGTGEERLYDELTLEADGGVRVKRYQAQRTSGKRQAIPFTLTHEALGRLVGAIAG